MEEVEREDEEEEEEEETGGKEGGVKVLSILLGSVVSPEKSIF